MGGSGRYHERLEATVATKRASNRSFGLVFLFAFLAIAVFLWWHGSRWAVSFAAAGLAFGGLALLAPRTLAPLNWLWTQFGLILHRLISPIVITALFFLVITPVGLLMRLCGQRPLNLKFDAAAKTYWMSRNPPGPRPGSLRRQY